MMWRPWRLRQRFLTVPLGAHSTAPPTPRKEKRQQDTWCSAKKRGQQCGGAGCSCTMPGALLQELVMLAAARPESCDDDLTLAIRTLTWEHKLQGIEMREGGEAQALRA